MYLSKDPKHLAALQRQRRRRMTRVDYMPGPQAQEAIAVARSKVRPGSLAATNSAILDSIVEEWAELTGINKRRKSKPTSSERKPELTDANARASKFGGSSSVENKAKQSIARVPCGARRRRDGEPCQALSVPGKMRCKWHGGCSTGPRTDEGRMRARANLRQFTTETYAESTP